MKKLFLIVLINSLLSCKANKEVQAIVKKNPIDWKVEGLKNFNEEDKVFLKIVNINANNLVIFNPFEKIIEQFDGNNWVRISTPYCPCGNCASPPETTSILTKDSYTFLWDKKTVICTNQQKEYKIAPAGRYRLIMNYEENENVKSYKKFVVEFTLE